MSAEDSTLAQDDEGDPPPAAPGSKRPMADDLFERVYAQLRGLAQKQMNAERPGHTLSATALVHEAYLRLLGPRRVAWQAEAHFYVAAAEAMRRILIDHARARCAARRGGGCEKGFSHERRGGPEARRAALRLTELPDPASEADCAGFLILDETISRLEGADSQAAAVVRLRYYGGLSIEETARTLGISEPTVKRAWAFARAWLKETLERDS